MSIYRQNMKKNTHNRFRSLNVGCPNCRISSNSLILQADCIKDIYVLLLNVREKGALRKMFCQRFQNSLKTFENKLTNNTFNEIEALFVRLKIAEIKNAILAKKVISRKINLFFE